jgi:arsenate reductase (thioredoxin)
VQQKLAFLFAAVFCTSAFSQDVHVLLSLENGKTTYRSGELIRVVLSFTAPHGDYRLNAGTNKPVSPVDEIDITPETGVDHWLDEYSGGHRFHPDGIPAGTKPSSVRPEAITAMRELGIDISGHRSKSVEEFDGQKFDYVITVCDSARESCPVFFGGAKRLHHDFDDPAALNGSEEERLAVFRRVRDELRAYLAEFAHSAAA